MEENQTNQNLNQQPVQGQPVQNSQQVQQPVQGQAQPTEQPSVSMQIQQLLVQQQQYQQQYNQLVDYVKKTPNLPIEQVNQIKQQLDQLNALFVQGKQQLQALGYNQIQVTKPVEVKKGSKNNFSFKKLAIGCGIVLLLIFVGFFVTLSSLIKNPDALQGIGVDASNAKIILQAFTGLLFGSMIILMLGVVLSRIYALVTVKNQSKTKNVLSMIGGIIGAGLVGFLMAGVFSWIGQIVVNKPQASSYPVQAYLVGRVEEKGKDEFKFPYDDEGKVGKNYPLIAPSEFAFKLKGSQILNYQYKNFGAESTLKSIKLVCGNKQGQKLNLLGDVSQIQEGSLITFDGTCLYGQKGTYKYSLEIEYRNNINKETLTKTVPVKSLTFTSEISISLTKRSGTYSDSSVSRIYPTNGEFLLGKAPAKVSISTTQVFRDFGLDFYNVTWDMDEDEVIDRENQVNFDYSYLIPRVYHPSVKFPDLIDFTYTFPVRVDPNDLPVCRLKVENFSGTNKYKISTQFTNPADAANISSYKYTIKNISSNKVYEQLKDQTQEIDYTFPEIGNYSVIMDYVTVDGHQGWCDSDTIQQRKQTFDVQYTILKKDKDTDKFKELCSSKGSNYNGCKNISIDKVPQEFQLQLRSVTPSSNTLMKAVYLGDKAILNENDSYVFTVPDEGEYVLKIVTSDEVRKMEEETREIKITAKKPDIVGDFTIKTYDNIPENRVEISEGFEPLSVVLDVSKTEINIPGDKIVYFTWDFGDGEVKKNQQNGVAVHTYTYDYKKENGIFKPKVTITTLKGTTQVIEGPTLNVKKGLINVELSSTSHPTRQAQVDREVSFQAEFDGLPEKMIRDFGDGTPTYTCQGRACTDVTHTFTTEGMFTVKLTLEFDAIQKVDGTMDFKVY